MVLYLGDVVGNDLALLDRVLAGAVAVGPTHTTENLAPREHFGGCQEAVGGGPLPFRHIVAGVASGASAIGRRSTSSSRAIFSTRRKACSSSCSLRWPMTEAMPDGLCSRRR